MTARQLYLSPTSFQIDIKWIIQFFPLLARPLRGHKGDQMGKVDSMMWKFRKLLLRKAENENGFLFIRKHTKNFWSHRSVGRWTSFVFFSMSKLSLCTKLPIKRSAFSSGLILNTKKFLSVLQAWFRLIPFSHRILERRHGYGKATYPTVFHIHREIVMFTSSSFQEFMWKRYKKLMAIFRETAVYLVS